jgi:hypothetical protein
MNSNRWAPDHNFTHMLHDVQLCHGIDSRGHHWTVKIDGKPIKRKGILLMFAGSIWAEREAIELIEKMERGE